MMRFIQIFILLLTFTGSASAIPITNLFNFGDSFSDTGNTLQTFGTPVPPYSEGRFTGEFTNGDAGNVWYDIVADELGFSAQNSFSGGNNYAFGGARTGPLLAGFPPSLLDQTQRYLTDVAGVADPNALYSVFGGGNDIRNNDIGSSVANISSIITQLHSAGAMNFFLPNMLDFGLTPESLVDGAPGGTAAVITAASVAFNTELHHEVGLLEANLGVNIIEFDLFSIFNDIILDPAFFGFINVTDACYDGTVNLCADLNSHLFFDSIHPTAAAHTLLGNLASASIMDAMSVANPVPVPATLPLLLSALLILGLRRKSLLTTG